MQGMEKARRDAWIVVHEANYAPNTNLLKITPQSANLEIIETILAYVGAPGGNLGLLELGAYDAIPVPVGVLTPIPGKWRLRGTDPRILSVVTDNANVPGARASGPAGYLYLGLFGSEVPDGAWIW